MAAPQSVIEKIQKLLALAGNNPNEHEAASAAAKAQEMLREHDLQMADVDVTMDPRTAGITQTERETLRQRGKPGGWKWDLYRAVAATSDCWPMGYDHNAYMVGRKQDVEIASYLYDYLAREIERLQKAFGDTRWAELRDWARENGRSTHYAETRFSAAGRHPLKAKSDWVKGAVPAVIQILRRQKQERDSRSDGDRALVISKESAIRDWYAQQRGYQSWDAMYPPAQPSTTPAKPPTAREQRQATARAEREWAKYQRRQQREADRLDWDAYTAGQQAGRSISVRPGVES